MTSLARELGAEQDVDAFATTVAERLGEVYEREPVEWADAARGRSGGARRWRPHEPTPRRAHPRHPLARQPRRRDRESRGGRSASASRRGSRCRRPAAPTYRRLKETIDADNLHTVCEEANCPNVGECWERGTATFMILGDVCTRRCGFCNVQTGKSRPGTTRSSRCASRTR